MAHPYRHTLTVHLRGGVTHIPKPGWKTWPFQCNLFLLELKSTELHWKELSENNWQRTRALCRVINFRKYTPNGPSTLARASLVMYSPVGSVPEIFSVKVRSCTGTYSILFYLQLLSVNLSLFFLFHHYNVRKKRINKDSDQLRRNVWGLVQKVSFRRENMIKKVKKKSLETR